VADRSHIAALPWSALRAFEAASRLGSFKAAADALSVTPTAISHQIKRLEAHLGLRLFERLHRALRLTAAGETLAEEAQRAFARLERTIDALVVDGRAAGAQALTVSVVPSLAAKWLAPRLHRFQTNHPRTGLRVIAIEELVDFRRDATVDIALRYGPGPYHDGVLAERLWPSGEIVAVGTADLARDASLREPADLVRQMLIRTAAPTAVADRGETTARWGWPAWFAAAGVPIDAAVRRALKGPMFSNTQLAIEAAASGRGVALAPLVLVEPDIASGRLVRLFEASYTDPNAFWLVCRSDRRGEAGIRAFMRWIRQEADKTASAGGQP
jgi:LysR family glycine cleavage system transcriptional activator